MKTLNRALYLRAETSIAPPHRPRGQGWFRYVIKPV